MLPTNKKINKTPLKSLPPLKKWLFFCWMMIYLAIKSRLVLGKGKKYIETSVPATKTHASKKKQHALDSSKPILLVLSTGPSARHMWKDFFIETMFAPLRWQLCSGSWWTPLSQVEGYEPYGKSVKGILLFNFRSWPFPNHQTRIICSWQFFVTFLGWWFVTLLKVKWPLNRE